MLVLAKRLSSKKPILSASRGLLARFLKAEATGQTAAMVSAYTTLKSGVTNLVRKMGSRVRPLEEASGRFCPEAGFDEPTLARDECDGTSPATRKTLEPVLFQELSVCPRLRRIWRMTSAKPQSAVLRPTEIHWLSGNDSSLLR
jgi:hypothetical protein